MMHRFPQTDSGFFYLGSSLRKDTDANQTNDKFFGRMDQRNNWDHFALKYFDAESGETVFVCAKPNCLHDGNEFCTATTKNYLALCEPVWLDGYVYMVAASYTELNKNPDNCTKYPTVLLRYSPDGTEVTELTQIHFSENPYSAYADMIAHRGQLWINFAYKEWFIARDANMQITSVETKGGGAMYCYEPEAKRLTALCTFLRAGLTYLLTAVIFSVNGRETLWQRVLLPSCLLTLAAAVIVYLLYLPCMKLLTKKFRSMDAAAIRRDW